MYLHSTLCHLYFSYCYYGYMAQSRKEKRKKQLYVSPVAAGPLLVTVHSRVACLRRMVDAHHKEASQHFGWQHFGAKNDWASLPYFSWENDFLKE